MEVLIEQLNRHYTGKSNATQKPILALALAVLLPLLTCGGALAQDLSGIYYIASEYDAESESAGTQYSSTGSPASHFYWVPAKNAVRDNKEDAYYKYSIYGYEKPYLTTYQTNRDLNSIWVLQKTGDYYYIVHALTGKYLVYSPIVPDPSHATRRVVHLAAQTDPNVDSAKFTVTQDANGKTLFVPKLKSSGDRYLNPAGHNRQSYSAVNEKDYSGGIIGVWSGNTGLSLWHLEDASEDVNIRPVISDLDPASNTFTITSPLSLFSSIRYTDDGSTPTHVDGTLYSGTVVLTETKTIRPTTTGGGQTVLTSKISTVANNVPSNGSVFDYAIVLVGNHQYRTLGEHVKGTNETGGFTLMSVDLDFDEEPDYCLEWQLGINTTRQSICPIRFDFLPVVEIGLALKENGSTQYYSLGCYRPLGHFEVTESALIRFGQFEFGNDSRTLAAPLILNGGIYEQFTKGTVSSATAVDDDITYIIVGGNVVMPSFTPGAHVRNTNQTRHCAVNAIGGHFDYFYLTGNYNENVTPNADNPHCYIDGVLFGQVAAAGKEGINGNVFFQINHAVIHEFYGGGDKGLITGSTQVNIKD